MGVFFRFSGVLCAVALTMSSTTGAVSATPETPAPVSAKADRILIRPAHGEKAVTELGDQLASVAARNEMTAAELKKLLRTDSTIWVDPGGRLFAIDPAQETSAATMPAPAAPYPYSETFSLHSKPGSQRVIYLDFDGHVVSGTAWNNAPYNVGTDPQPAFDIDANPATFGTAEQDLVQDVWQRVSEDYAPFDVDVTTADPGAEAIRRASASDQAFGTRALITPSAAASSAICGGGCGGVAFLGTFDQAPSDGYQPAWVFPQGLGPDNAKYIADAVSHEVGHNLGLNHDADVGGAGYYPGHGAWGPIMGGPYDFPISQWSNGGYTPGGNDEDDFAVIGQNGVALRGDDHGNTLAAASPMTGGTSLTQSGVITSRGDKDYLSLTHGCPGNVTVSASPAPTGTNLDIGLRLLSSDGNVVASADPPSAMTSYRVASGMAASVTSSVPPGSYFVEVDGVGALDPASTGYSDFGSVGEYTVTASACVASQPTAPTSVVVTKNDGARTASITWQPPTTVGDSPVNGYVVRLNGAPATLPESTRSHTFTGLAPGATYGLSVAAVNTTGAGLAASGSVTIAATSPGSPTAFIATASQEDRTATLTWSPPATDGGSPVSGYVVRLNGAATNLTASARSHVFADLTRGSTYDVSVEAVNQVGAGSLAQQSVTIGFLKPAAPTAVKATRGKASAVVTWGAPINLGNAVITGYRVRRFASTSRTLLKSSDVSATSRRFPATGLTNGKPYTFDVIALTAHGPGMTSARSNVVVPATVPGQPRIGRGASGAAGGPVTAKATWSAPASTGGSAVKGYRVTALRMGATGRVLGKTVSSVRPATSRSFVMRLRAGKYRFTVVATNAVGTSAASARSRLVTGR